ncbi:hypothetical protein ABIA18_001338 [Sinorhizobium fredii]
MVRKFCLALAVAASALAIAGAAWADFTILVPSSAEGDGLRAAARRLLEDEGHESRDRPGALCKCL